MNFELKKPWKTHGFLLTFFVPSYRVKQSVFFLVIQMRICAEESGFTVLIRCRLAR